MTAFMTACRAYAQRCMIEPHAPGITPARVRTTCMKYVWAGAGIIVSLRIARRSTSDSCVAHLDLNWCECSVERIYVGFSRRGTTMGSLPRARYMRGVDNGADVVPLVTAHGKASCCLREISVYTTLIEDNNRAG